jgi:hypothetical protein
MNCPIPIWLRRDAQQTPDEGPRMFETIAEFARTAAEGSRQQGRLLLLRFGETRKPASRVSKK